MNTHIQRAIEQIVLENRHTHTHQLWNSLNFASYAARLFGLLKRKLERLAFIEIKCIYFKNTKQTNKRNFVRVCVRMRMRVYVNFDRVHRV